MRERRFVISVGCVCVCLKESAEHHRVDRYIWMFGSLCMMCVKCVCVCVLDELQPPRDGGCDHMLTTHPDRCDKCSNTSVSKRRVCNFLEGPLRDACCDIHSK